MAVSVSLINMKGGVGKTTLAAQVAHTADLEGLRTLVVDLDPQANLSQILLGPEKYITLLQDKKPTVVQLFEQYTPARRAFASPSPVNVHEVIIKKAGYGPGTTLDLIPSRLELARILKDPTNKEHRLARALSKVTDEYDLILIDCAPTESILTQAAYHSSRYMLVPVKPEYLATIGLPLLAQSIHDFKSANRDHDLDLCGIVFNHSSAYTVGPEGRKSMEEVANEASKNGWPLFKSQVRYSRSYAKAAREGTPLAGTSYARRKVTAEFLAFYLELLEAIGVEGGTT